MQYAHVGPPSVNMGISFRPNLVVEGICCDCTTQVLQANAKNKGSYFYKDPPLLFASREADYSVSSTFPFRCAFLSGITVSTSNFIVETICEEQKSNAA